MDEKTIKTIEAIIHRGNDAEVRKKGGRRGRPRGQENNQTQHVADWRYGGPLGSAIEDFSVVGPVYF